MQNGKYDCNTYIPVDQEEFKKNIESLNIKSLKLPPKELEISKVVNEWKKFEKKAVYLKYSLYIIPFAVTLMIFSRVKIIGLALMIASIAMAFLSHYRSHQANTQAAKWPHINSFIFTTNMNILFKKN